MPERPPPHTSMRRDHAAAVVAEGHGWTATRHRDPRAPGAAPPSLALLRELGPIRSAGSGPGPAFGDAPAPWAWSLRLDLGPGTDCYGLGEVSGPLRRNGRRTVCWNSDVPAYTPDDPALYQSHPWVLALRADGSAVGLLVDSTWRTEITPGETIEVRGRGVEPSVYVIEGRGPAEVLAGLGELVGRAPLPPRWAMGYHQCRWSYYPAARVLEVARGFRERSIPCDAIWMDIDYMHGFRCFTFDPERFADPHGLNRELHELGFHTVWMIDPGMKAQAGYDVYDTGSAIDAWVKDADGSPFTGEVWPGDCVFPDFTRRDVRAWWAGLYERFLGAGVDAVWNDMNEPSVFDGPHKTMPEDNRHDADEELGGPDAHERYHNVYGMLMVRATREGMLAARPERRPFVLTRANFIGGHRYAATWTGDNVSSWKDLGWSIPMVLNLGLSGQPMCGPDIGGFNEEADGPLFARWMGIGALLPFARGHTVTGSADHEPWSFGPECERTCRRALEVRSRLMPYLYTAFEDATRTGIPMVRPLFFLDPADPALRAVEDSFMIGDDLLVRARVSPHGHCTAPPPPPDWRRLMPLPEHDPDLPELYVRPGRAIPLGPIRQHDADRSADDRLDLVASLDDRGEARTTIYEDEGDGHAHEHGVYRRTTWLVRGDAGHATATIEHAEGDWTPPDRPLRAIILD